MSFPALPTKSSALVVVDVQRGFDDESYWGVRNNPDCEDNIAALLRAWRTAAAPIVLVQHSSSNPSSPLHPSNPGHDLKPGIDGPAALTVTKNVNSAFHGIPDLHQWLTTNDISDVVICGITTNHCCETTARVAGNLGYRVWFVEDATHTFDREGPHGRLITAAVLQEVTVTNLHQEFASIVDTADMVAALR